MSLTPNLEEVRRWTESAPKQPSALEKSREFVSQQAIRMPRPQEESRAAPDVENLEQSYGVQCRYFKVRGDEEGVYILLFRRDSGSLGADHVSTPANLS